MRYDGVNEPQRRRTSCLPHCHVSSFICRLPLSLSVAPMLRDAKCENQQRHGDVYGAGTMAPHYGRIIKSIREVYPFLFFFSFLTKGFNNLTVYVYRDVRARPKGGGSNSWKINHSSSTDFAGHEIPQPFGRSKNGIDILLLTDCLAILASARTKETRRAISGQRARVTESVSHQITRTSQRTWHIRNGWLWWACIGLSSPPDGRSVGGQNVRSVAAIVDQQPEPDGQ